MRRRAFVLSCAMACALAGCGGTGSVATGPADPPLDLAAAVPSPVPEATTTVAPTTAPTTEAPPPPTVAPTTAPAPRVVATTPTTQPEPEPAPVVTPAAAGGCDPSYPGVCIPPGPPDLDCADIPHRRFTVVGADPHRFDGNDDDGIGCESN